MRYVASALLLAWFTIGLSITLNAASGTQENAEPTKLYGPFAEETAAQKAFGVHEETPNQRRIRLGEPIEASYPPPEYGELLETPNQRRQRLGLPMSDGEVSQTASLQ